MQARLEALEEQEKKLEKKIDLVADRVAERMGYRTLPWLKATWFLLWVYTILTILVLIQRSDFINLTICVTALYMLFNTQTLTRTRFRVLVLGIIVSWIYDILWFFLKFREFSEHSKDESQNVEKNVRRFSLVMSVASFILRVSLMNNLCVLDFCGNRILERLNGLC